MIPCCFNVITCEEHDALLEEQEEHGPPLGGAMGKLNFCPRDAAHAHQLLSEIDSRNTRCDNPGSSVPSPYDSCNTCSCTQSGMIGACTEVGCIDGGDLPSCYDECLGSGKGGRQCSAECSPVEDLEPPYNQLTYCNEDGDNGEAYCKEQTDDEFTFCHRLTVFSCFINNEEVEQCDGICIPKDVSCDSDDDCKAIGSIHSGQVMSFCRNNICDYDTGIAIA
jgi:hypothetical protein